MVLFQLPFLQGVPFLEKLIAPIAPILVGLTGIQLFIADDMVGWRTSSIRTETELLKPPHVVDVEYCPPISSEDPDFPPEGAKAKEVAQNEPSPQNTLEYHEIMEGTSMEQKLLM